MIYTTIYTSDFLKIAIYYVFTSIFHVKLSLSAASETFIYSKLINSGAFTGFLLLSFANNSSLKFPRQES